MVDCKVLIELLWDGVRCWLLGWRSSSLAHGPSGHPQISFRKAFHHRLPSMVNGGGLSPVYIQSLAHVVFMSHAATLRICWRS